MGSISSFSFHYGSQKTYQDNLISNKTHNYSNINLSYPPLMSFINDQLGYILGKPKEKKKETKQSKKEKKEFQKSQTNKKGKNKKSKTI